MIDILVAVIALFVTPRDADALRSTAPTYLTLEAAREHLISAIVAGTVTRTDPMLLLSISHHESRYKYTEITVEPPHPKTGKPRWSCGVMTPEPISDRAACSIAASSALEGYLAGAKHLRAWLHVCREHQGCALRGYAGAATHDCAREMTLACVAAADFAQRAVWIRGALTRARDSSSRS